LLNFNTYLTSKTTVPYVALHSVW